MNAETNPERRQGCGWALVLVVGILILTMLAALVLFGIWFVARPTGRTAGVAAGRPLPFPSKSISPDVDSVAEENPASGQSPGQRTEAIPAAQEETQPGAESPAGRRLSELEPSEVVGVNLGSGKLVRKVRLGGRWWEHGLWAQPASGQEPCQISYLLDKSYTRLRGVAGIAGAEGGPPVPDGGTAPAAVFRIYGDGNLLWESELLRGRGATSTFDVRLSGVTVLALLVESGAPASAPDCAWADLDIEKAGENVHAR